MKKILFIFGTRPEAIKLAPVIQTFKEKGKFTVKTCISSQHKELLLPLLDMFNITPDYNLDIMTKNQSLSHITTSCLNQMDPILRQEKPDLIIVQGDTTTAFSGALSGFYQQIPVAHIEAGLRTFDSNNPFPEEINRKLISECTTYHFAPTDINKTHLNQQGITNNIWVVGNTGIDSFKQTLKHVQNGFTSCNSHLIDPEKKTILVTGHRRENTGKTFTKLCKELKKISELTNIRIIFPLHLNPTLQTIANNELNNCQNIHLIGPQLYPDFVWLMEKASLIITDSGGIQEEAPYIGKPVFITRKKTERYESLTSNSKLIDINTETLSHSVQEFFNNPALQNSLSQKSELYGTGSSSENIHHILSEKLSSVAKATNI